MAPTRRAQVAPDAPRNQQYAATTSASSHSTHTSSSAANAAQMLSNSRGRYQTVPNDVGGPTSPPTRYGQPAGDSSSTESQRQARGLLGGPRSVASDSNSSQGDLGPYSHINQGSMGPIGQRGRGGQNRAAANPRTATSSNSGRGGYVANGRSQMLQVAPKTEANRWSYNSAISADTKQTYRLSVPTQEELFVDKTIPEADDYLHNPDGKKDRAGWHLCSARGLTNFLVLLILFCGLMALFAGYPIISALTRHPESDKGGFNLGGTNGSGQVPVMDNLFSLIDRDTPQSAQTWTNPLDNTKFHIVFSDEFNQEGRTFWPGDDPFWEAVDIWYGVTGDKEWYSPEAANTTNGFLQLTMSEKVTHNLNFQSGMIQSWNKFCFQGGYIEFAAILPGSPETQGWWPGLWTMGNLGRAGYPGTTDGMWPYSYDSCDTGILPNQTTLDGTGPADAPKNHLPGMRASSCTCSGDEHPGPNHNVGRSAPELDILEAQTSGGAGQVSQSVQTAPFDAQYHWKETAPSAVIYDADATHFNPYTGGQYQEALSGLTTIPNDAYELAPQPRAVRFGAYYTPDWTGTGDGEVTWFVDGQPSWTVRGSAVGPNPDLDIGQRLIPVEPMSIVMNLGMSDGFQTIHYDTLQFPATLKVDYVRVYQPDGQTDRISCDPPDHPTADYINSHPEIYMNPNHTVYPVDIYGRWPQNRLTGCS